MTERKALFGFYLFWLCVSVGFVIFHHDFNEYMFTHLFYILVVPLIGLWFLYWKRNIGYVCVGVLFAYAGLQLIYLKDAWQYFLLLHDMLKV